LSIYQSITVITVPITFTIPNQISRIKISKTANMVFSMKSLATATTIFSPAHGAVLGKRALTGEATTYRGNTAGGACSFSTYTLPSSIFGTALSDSNWDTAANCGRCVSVTGPSGNSITAMVNPIKIHYSAT
jgi:hypothetical protein